MKIISKKNTKQNKENFYLGIQILRIIFSFHILVFHCIDHKKYTSKIISSVVIDLNTFFIIAFFFSYNTLTSKNILKIKQRFKRLLIPYILWPIIFLIIRIIISKINILEQLKYLFYQLLIGNGTHIVLWFQFNLIFVSLFSLIIIFLSRAHYLLYIFIFGVLCLFFIHSSIYKNLNSKFNKIVLFSTLPLPSSYIYLVIGFYIFFLKIIEKINKYKFFSMIFFLMNVCFYIFCEEIYSNSRLIRFFISYFSSICLFLFFIIFPFDKIINYKFINAIKRISYYAGGIYYLHTKILIVLYSLKIIEKGSISICLLNYITCYYICLFGYYIFKNTELRYLFI